MGSGRKYKMRVSGVEMYLGEGCYYQVWDLNEYGIMPFDVIEIGPIKFNGLPLPDGCKEVGIKGMLEYEDHIDVIWKDEDVGEEPPVWDLGIPGFGGLN